MSALQGLLIASRQLMFGIQKRAVNIDGQQLDT